MRPPSLFVFLSNDLFDCLSHLLHSSSDGDEFRTSAGTTTAAYAHMVVFETCLVVMEFVENFVTHTLTSGFAEYMSASHISKAFDLAGSGGTFSLTNVGVFVVNDVSGAEAGTGAAGNGTGTAGDTAFVVLVPHWMTLQF